MGSLKILVLAVLLTLTSGCLAFPHPSSPSKSLVNHIENSTAALVILTPDGEYKPYCSAFFINSNDKKHTYLMTAGHCARGLAQMLSEDTGVEAEPVGLKFTFITRYQAPNVFTNPTGLQFATSIAVDEDHDLALLKVDGPASTLPQHDSLTLASSEVSIGETVYIVGHPRGWYWTFSTGTVEAVRNNIPELDFIGKFYMVGCNAFFGNSGGPLTNSDGELIGVTSFLTKVPNTTFYVHQDSIRKFLSNNDILKK